MTVDVTRESRREFDVWNEVPLVPQTTGMSCWAAAASMIVGWRDRIPVDPVEVASGAGRWEAYRDGLEPNDVATLARTWGLTVEPVHELTSESLRRTLQEYGPLWVGEASPALHSIVVTGIRGDGTPDGTYVRINDPWPVGRGERYVLRFRDFAAHILAAHEAVGEHAQLLHTGGRRRGAHRWSHHESHSVRVQTEQRAYGTPVRLFEAFHPDRAPSGTRRPSGSTGRSCTDPDNPTSLSAARVLQRADEQPRQGADTMAIIAIDPGHGGTTRVGGSSPNNATGPAGTLEKELTLDVGLALRDVLQQRGHQVVMTRDSDVNLGLADRAHVARDNNAHVFVSIHFNGWEDPDTQGTVTFVHEDAGSESAALAAAVQSAVQGVTGYNDRGVKRARFGVLNPGRHNESTAACLVEVSFLTNPAEEDRLTRNEPVNGVPYRTAIANAIADGIDAHLTASAPAQGLRRIGGFRGYGSVIDRARDFGPEVEDAVRRLLDEGVSEAEVGASLDQLTVPAAPAQAVGLSGRRELHLPRVHLLSDLDRVRRVLGDAIVAAARRLLPSSGGQSFDALAAGARDRRITIARRRPRQRWVWRGHDRWCGDRVRPGGHRGLPHGRLHRRPVRGCERGDRVHDHRGRHP